MGQNGEREEAAPSQQSGERTGYRKTDFKNQCRRGGQGGENYI